MGGLEMRKEQFAWVNEQFNNTLPGVQYSDVQPGQLWDCINLDRGQTINSSLVLFSTPMGCLDPYTNRQKTIVDTNMCTGCRLDAPESFSVKRIIFTFSKNADPIDVVNMCEEIMWGFWLGAKRQYGGLIISLPSITRPIAPIKICEYCKAVYANQELCPGCGARHFTLTSMDEYSDEGRQFVLELSISTVILNQMNFRMLFNGQYTFEHKFKMWVHLEGLHARGIQ